MSFDGSRSSGTSGAFLAPGRNFMMRQFISLTSSSPTRHSAWILMNQLSPSAVCLGPKTSVTSLVVVTCSPNSR
ncbi:Uncharacterised protein [Mycobacteroides abscessus subsp. abscessus]|nr:Uncharacterised protein [Mycobacteroides abscessus subsp. abscessus]